MKDFNIVLIGVGGQGVLSLAKLLEDCALAEGYSVKGIEQHGLAQRGGSIKCHVRFGSSELFTPMVRQGGADLVIAAEALEGLRSLYYVNPKTKILLNLERTIPVESYFKGDDYPSNDEIIAGIKKFSSEVYSVDGSNKVREATGESFFTNSFLLGYAIAKGLLPIKKEIALKVLKEIFKNKFLEENLKAFELAFS